LIVPGVEVMPHYFWTGSPASLSMTLHNVQKNLLVFGISDPKKLSSLAATGNRYESRYSWQSLADVTPVLLVVPGLVLLRRKRREHRRFGRTIVVVWRRRWGLGLALLAVGLFAVVRGWPFTVDRYPPWQDAGLEPYQTLIDQVDRLGGASMWSFPETADVGQRHVGPVQRSEEHTSELQSRSDLVCRLLLEKKKTNKTPPAPSISRAEEEAAGQRGRRAALPDLCERPAPDEARAARELGRAPAVQAL